MAEHVRLMLPAVTGYRSTEIGSFVSQLDDLTRLMMKDVEGATVEELAWQPAPGCNTIGMLLAHIAVVEVFWIQVAPLHLKAFDTMPALGIGIDDDGLPLESGGAPPAALSGRDVAWYAERMRLARVHTVEHLRNVDDAELTLEFQRTRRNGEVNVTNLRWVLYHLVEHLAGHYGQILLLRHLYRDVKSGVTISLAR